MHHFDAKTTARHLPFEHLLPVLREAFAAGAHVPPRHVHAISLGASRPAAGHPDADTGQDTGDAVQDAVENSPQNSGQGTAVPAPPTTQGTVLIMPAWSEAGFLGIKTINIFPGNSALGLPGLHASYVLYNARTGVPLALLDGNEITAHRTAAASALGSAYLARPDARRLLILGTGRVARLLPAAYRKVRPIDEVWVWNHRAQGAQALAAQWRAQGINARAVSDLAAAVQHADVVSCATLATEPLVQGAWLAPGSHLDLIGSFTPAMTEADPACFRGAKVFVDTEEALQKAGDLLNAIAAGALAVSSVQAGLAQLCRGEHPGRQSVAERTVFKAVGTGLADLAAATLVWHAAMAQGETTTATNSSFRA